MDKSWDFIIPLTFTQLVRKILLYKYVISVQIFYFKISILYLQMKWEIPFSMS
jgi:hypothetical protein